MSKQRRVGIWKAKVAGEELKAKVAGDELKAKVAGEELIAKVAVDATWASCGAPWVRGLYEAMFAR